MAVLVREKVKGSGVWGLSINYGGKRMFRRVGSKEAAKAAARKVEEALATGALNLNAPEVPTLKEYAERWYAGYVQTNLKISTQRSVRMILDKFLLPAFGDFTINQITREDVRQLLYQALESGRVKTKKLPDGTETKRLSRASVLGLGRTLSAIFNHAIEDGILTVNPASRLGKFLKHGDRGAKCEVLTFEEGRLFLETAKAYFPRHYPIFAAAFYTGMRQGELVALKWDDIDFHGSFIEVRRAIWQGTVSTPKSGKGRRVDMADTLKTIIIDHKRTLAADALKKGRSISEWVFPPLDRLSKERSNDAPELAPFDPANLRKAFSSCLRRAGLRQIRFHDIRHCYASWMIGNGESVVYVAAQLGHASSHVTLTTYSHALPGGDRSAVNRLGAALQNAPPACRDKKRGQTEVV